MLLAQNEARVVQPDIAVGPVVAHAVDAVLLPNDVSERGARAAAAAGRLWRRARASFCVQATAPPIAHICYAAGVAATPRRHPSHQQTNQPTDQPTNHSHVCLSGHAPREQVFKNIEDALVGTEAFHRMSQLVTGGASAELAKLAAAPDTSLTVFVPTAKVGAVCGEVQGEGAGDVGSAGAAAPEASLVVVVPAAKVGAGCGEGEGAGAGEVEGECVGEGADAAAAGVVGGSGEVAARGRGPGASTCCNSTKQHVFAKTYTHARAHAIPHTSETPPVHVHAPRNRRSRPRACLRAATAWLTFCRTTASRGPAR